MINKIECETISCDNCKQLYEDNHEGFTIFLNANDNDIANQGWHDTHEGKHYCDKCHSINDNHELQIDITKYIPD